MLLNLLEFVNISPASNVVVDRFFINHTGNHFYNKKKPIILT